MWVLLQTGKDNEEFIGHPRILGCSRDSSSDQ